MHIFISYSREDIDLAESLAIRLRDMKQNVFFDRSDISATESFDSIIRTEIEKADFLIFVASAESLEYGAYALAELNMFKKRFKTPRGRVLTILERGQALDGIPSYLRASSIPDIRGDKVAETTAIILDCLKRLRIKKYHRILVIGVVCISFLIVAALIVNVYIFNDKPLTRDDRLKLYDACIVNGGHDQYTSNCCDHLTASDAASIRVCAFRRG